MHVYIGLHTVASELKDPICHSNECQIGSFSSEATIHLLSSRQPPTDLSMHPCIHASYTYMHTCMHAYMHYIGLHVRCLYIERGVGLLYPVNTKHLYNAGPTSRTLCRRCTNVIQIICVCWVCMTIPDRLTCFIIRARVYLCTPVLCGMYMSLV